MAALNCIVAHLISFTSCMRLLFSERTNTLKRKINFLLFNRDMKYYLQLNPQKFVTETFFLIRSQVCGTGITR